MEYKADYVTGDSSFEDMAFGCKFNLLDRNNPKSRYIFKRSAYFGCLNFNYSYSSAVNSYNYAHNGSSKRNYLRGVVLSESDWEEVVNRLRRLVTDVYMRSIEVSVYYFGDGDRREGEFQSGYVFKYGGEIIAYSIWDRVCYGDMDIVRIDDEGYIF